MLLNSIKPAVLKLGIGLQNDIAQKIENLSAILDEIEAKRIPEEKAVKYEFLFAFACQHILLFTVLEYRSNLRLGSSETHTHVVNKQTSIKQT